MQILTFEDTQFNFSKKNIESDILTLKIKSSDFVNYLAHTPLIKIKNKKYILDHVKVTIEGKVLSYCFKGDKNTILNISDNEP